MAKTVQERATRCARWPKKWTAKNQRIDANADRVRTLVRSDRRLGVTLLAEELNINRETLRQIITEGLGMRKVSAKMVPRILTVDQEQPRLHISSDLLHNAEMLDRVSTGDETWPDKWILHHENAPAMMREEFASSWLRTPLQK
jgi:hypothetical protein